MRTTDIGRAIAAASLTFGIMDITFGKAFGRGIGAGERSGAMLFRSVGVREIATGLAGLVMPRKSAPIWVRFGADLADIAVLSTVASRPNSKRGMAALAIAIVAGVAALDFFAARAIDHSGPRGAGPSRTDPAFALNGD